MLIHIQQVGILVWACRRLESVKLTERRESDLCELDVYARGTKAMTHGAN